MATASELKGKVTKILTIVEYLEDENINNIEKDILLQAVRDLYTDILVTKTEISEAENSGTVEEVEEKETEKVVDAPAETVETPTEPPVIAIPFDAGDFDFHDLLDMDNDDKKTDEPVVVEEEPQEEIPEKAEDNVADEPVEVEDFADQAAEEQETSVEELDETHTEEVHEEMKEPEETTEAQKEPIDEASAEESKFENEYFSQNESVSSDYSDSIIEEPVAEEQPEKIFELVAEEPVTEEIAEPVEEPAIEEQPEEIHEPSVEEEFASEVVSKEIVDEVAVEEPAIEENPVEVEPEIVPEPTVVEEAVTPAEPIHQEPEPEKVITLGEQLGQSRQESLNDKFANNKSADLSSSIGLKPISDIKSSIPLGERFLFTRTLFSGSGALFESTVAALNGMSSMEEAEGYIRANFNWDMESSTVADFMNIVRRRYL